MFVPAVEDLLQAAAEALNARAGLREGFPSKSHTKCGRRASLEGCAVHDGHAFLFEQGGDEVFVRLDKLTLGARLADRACARGVDVERALGFGQLRPDAWFSMLTTRSRRSTNTLLFAAMKSCGPFKASTPAHCVSDVGFEVD